jgi:Tol biopolymer transport system component
VLAGAVVLVFATSVAAQINNGSFESGLTGWTLGPGSRVEALQSANFGPSSIPVPDGNWFALLCTGPGDTAGPPGDFDVNGVQDHDASTLSTTFTTTTVNEILGFQWSFLTDEVGPGGQGDPLYDDLFDVTIDGVSILPASVRKPDGSSPFPDTVAYDNLRYTVSSPGLANNCDFRTSPRGGRTPFVTASVTIADPGTYTLEFLVADQADANFDSGLLIDAVTLTPGTLPTTQVTASSGSNLEVKGGGFVFATVGNGRPAVSGDGTTLAFASNGDYNGDNPNLQPQIWTANDAGATWGIARLTAAVGAEFGDPAISANGQWLVFASDGDLASPGNGDGNFEIFRYDRGTAALTQITNTSGCESEEPTINDDGSRIAFVSDCDLGFGATGIEIVLWDGTFRGVETSGCVSRDPLISRDVSGRYVTFVTDCDGQYAGTSNPDGGLEILQWDTQTDTYLQITDTAAGLFNDGVGSSSDGRFVSFLSSADHETGENPAGDVVVLRYDRTSDSFLQLSDPDPLSVYTFTSIDGSGGFVAAERLNILTSVFEIVLFETASPRVPIPLASGASDVFVGSPVTAYGFNRALVAFQSDGDFSGTNPDRNLEVWVSGGAFDPPTPGVYCSAPNLPIPDDSTVGASDAITVSDTGPLVDVDVWVSVEHPFVGDLRVDFRHVDTGTTARLVARPGRPPGPGCSGDDIDATLDDEATTTVEDQCVTPGPIAINGTFSPNQSLRRFDGEDLSGDWELRVSDRGRNDVGTFLEWCLIPSTP